MTPGDAAHLLARGLARVVNVETLLWCWAPLEPGEPDGFPDWVRPARDDDRDGLARLCGGRRRLAKRLARGDVAVVADLDGEICGCLWLTTRPLHLPGYGLHVDASPVRPYGYGLTVARHVRRRGIGGTLVEYLRRVEAPRRGFREISYHISPRNPASYHRHEADPESRTLARVTLVVVGGVLPRVVRTRPALAHAGRSGWFAQGV